MGLLHLRVPRRVELMEWGDSMVLKGVEVVMLLLLQKKMLSYYQLGSHCCNHQRCL